MGYAYSTILHFYMKKFLIAFAIVIIVPIAWYLVAPLISNTVVDEEFPTTSSTNSSQSLNALSEIQVLENLTEEDIDAMSEAQKKQLEQAMNILADSMPNNVVEDAMPEEASNEPKLIAQGDFSGADSFHTASGTAELYTLADNSSLMRFTNFSVTNGPALHVFLVNESGQKIEIAPLKGNQGNQNYTIPNTIDTTNYNQVLIYCVPFKVTFATAVLR